MQPIPFYSGTSNVVLPVANKQAFPPEHQNKSRLGYYGTLFNSVEINSTFYKLPLAKTIARWVTEVPDNFQFTFKLWQEITHQKGLAFNPEQVKQFLNVITQAGDKKGCLLVQLPPSTSINLYQLNQLLSEIKLADPAHTWSIAVEFRHRSWYQDEVYEMLDQLQVSIVLHDLPASATPFRESETNSVYLRFHGPEGGYRGNYSDDFLYEYAHYIQDWVQNGKTVYAYFNNTLGEAVRNLTRLNQIVNELL